MKNHAFKQWRADRPLRVAIAFICLLALDGVTSFTIVAPYVNTFERAHPITGNLTIWKSRQLTFTYSHADTSALDVKVGDRYCDFVGSPPIYPFQTPLSEFTPIAQELHIRDVCIVDSPALINTSFIPETTPFPPGSIHRRRLLSALPLVAGAWVAIGIGSAIAGQSPVCGMSFGLFGCKKSDSGPQPNAAQIRQIDAAQRYADSQLKWTETELQGLTNQQRINLGFAEVLQQNTAALEESRKQQENLRDGINTLAQHVDNNQALNQQQFENMYDALGNVVSTVGDYIDDQVDLLQEQMLLNDQSIINTTRVIVANISANTVDSIERDREIARNLKTAISGQHRQFKRTDIYRELTKELWSAMNMANSNGYSIFSHPDSPGIEPTAYADIAEFDKTVIVDDICINLVNVSVPLGSIARAHQICFGWRASASEISDNQGIDVQYEDILELIGPPGCAANASGDGVFTVDRCRAWIEVTHKECQPTLGFHWDDISLNPSPAVSLDRPSYVLRSSLCRGFAPSSGFWHGQKIDSLPKFRALFNPLCAQQLASDPGHPHKKQIVSARGGIWDIPEPLNPDVCAFDIKTLFNSNLGYNTVPFTLFETLRLNFAALLKDGTVFDSIRWGGTPDFITFDEQPFRTLQDGRSYSCWRGSFVATKPETLPVHRVIPGTPQPLMTVTCHNRPVICPGCPPRVVLSTETTSKIISVVPAGNRLPTADDLIVGEWMGTGMTSLYDPDKKLMTKSLYGPARCHNFNYLARRPPSGFDYPGAVTFPETGDLEEWFQTYGPQFDHRCAALSLQHVERELSPSARCIMIGDVLPNWQCDLFEEWNVHSSTDMRAGILNLYPNQYSGLVTVDIVDGPISMRTYDGCPDYWFNALSTLTVDLYILNSNEFPIKVRVHRTSNSPQCPQLGDTDLDLQAKQQYVEHVPACGHYTVIVYAFGVDQELTACSIAPISVTVNATTSGLSDPTPLGSFNQTVINDKVAGGLLVVADNLQAFFLSMITYLPAVVNPALSQLDRETLTNSTIAALIAKINSDKAGIDIASHTATAALITFNTKFTASDLRIEGLVNASVAVMENEIKPALALQEIILANLTAQLADLKADNVALHVANDELKAELNARIAADDSCDTSLFGSFTNCGIGQVFSKVIILAIVIAGFIAIVWVAAKFGPGIIKGFSKSSKAASSGGEYDRVDNPQGGRRNSFSGRVSSGRREKRMQRV